uniref:Uncharacterized protein n=1 Tax=Ditylum brightwellii TaxID=49249 RepID=A0A7S4RFS0_9STRA|mmetsp:Transcript_14979/g.20038  ORF Transcript_14979/g.20038 Transcript_14979/m.20038 type:complete len:114 (+) Transcript_14979:1237-1578(+)
MQCYINDSIVKNPDPQTIKKFKIIGSFILDQYILMKIETYGIEMRVGGPLSSVYLDPISVQSIDVAIPRITQVLSAAVTQAIGCVHKASFVADGKCHLASTNRLHLQGDCTYH